MSPSGESPGGFFFVPRKRPADGGWRKHDFDEGTGPEDVTVSVSPAVDPRDHTSV
jgi:hypothetical protein